MATAPPKKIRFDRLLMVIILLGGAAFAGYWFGLR
jgi:hypothetical protein